MRRAKFLEVAALLIAELGYDAVTMTAIAKQAHSSIGTLYDYFPDKKAIALSLKQQYTMEADAHWKTLLSDPKRLTRAELANLFVEGALTLVRDRPAYLPLLGAPVLYSRSTALRQPLRKTIAGALQTMNPRLLHDRAFTHAQVIVQLIKGLFSVYREAAPKEREQVVEEFKKLFRLYLMEILH